MSQAVKAKGRARRRATRAVLRPDRRLGFVRAPAPRDEVRAEWWEGTWAYAIGRPAWDHPRYEEGWDRAKNDETRRWIRTWSDVDAVLHGCYFDARSAEYTASFFPSFLRLWQGPKAGEPYDLMDWLKWDIVYPVWGWMRATGTRRFKRLYIEIPKKNTKTCFASGATLYMLTADGRHGAGTFSAAVDRKMAKMVFTNMRAMIRSSPDLSRRLDVTPSTKTISYPATNSSYEALSADGYRSEGLVTYFVVVDELHAHKNREMFSSLRYGGRSDRQSMMMVITTAGIYNPVSIGWEQHDYARQVMEGGVEDPSYFAYMAGAEVGTGQGGWGAWARDAASLPRQDPPEIDETDEGAAWTHVDMTSRLDWTSEVLHRRANPAWGVTIDPLEIRQECIEAQRSAGAQGDFKRYTLNIWTLAVSQWIDSAVWMSGAMDAEALVAAAKHRRGYLALDVSDTRDITALALWWPPSAEEDDRNHYLLTWFWLPRENLAERERETQAPYREWATTGALRLTEGKRVDYRVVREQIDALWGTYDIHEIRYDPYNMGVLVQELQSEYGEDAVKPHRQGDVSMNAPTVEFERLVAEGKVKHTGCPCMAWQMSQSQIRIGSGGLVKIVKGDNVKRYKVDGPVCAVMGLSGAMQDVSPDVTVHVYY